MEVIVSFRVNHNMNAFSHTVYAKISKEMMRSIIMENQSDINRTLSFIILNLQETSLKSEKLKKSKRIIAIDNITPQDGTRRRGETTIRVHGEYADKIRNIIDTKGISIESKARKNSDVPVTEPQPIQNTNFTIQELNDDQYNKLLEELQLQMDQRNEVISQKAEQSEKSSEVTTKFVAYKGERSSHSSRNQHQLSHKSSSSSKGDQVAKERALDEYSSTEKKVRQEREAEKIRKEKWETHDRLVSENRMYEIKKAAE